MGGMKGVTWLPWCIKKVKSNRLEEIKRVKWIKRRQNIEIDGKGTIIKYNRSGIVREW